MTNLSLTSSPAGAVVADLLRRIDRYARPGSVPGADTVMVIGQWLLDLGLDWDRHRVGELVLVAQATALTAPTAPTALTPAVPAVSFDEATAAAWLRAPAPDSIDGETNAEDAGVFDDWDPEADGGDLLVVVDRLVVGADRAALFGDQVSVLAYITTGTDLIADGAVITVTCPRESAATRTLRLGSYHLDHGDLQWLRGDRGLDAALGILRSVAHHARTVAQDAARFLATEQADIGEQR